MTLEQLIHLMTRLSQLFSYSPQNYLELPEKLTQLIQKCRNDEETNKIPVKGYMEIDYIRQSR